MTRFSRPVASPSTPCFWPTTPIAWRTRTGSASDVEAGDAGAAGVRARERGEDPDGGGLAGAVGPEQAEDRAGRDREVEPVERADVAGVGLDEAVGLDGVGLIEQCTSHLEHCSSAVQCSCQ